MLVFPPRPGGAPTWAVSLTNPTAATWTGRRIASCHCPLRTRRSRRMLRLPRVHPIPTNADWIGEKWACSASAVYLMTWPDVHGFWYGCFQIMNDHCNYWNLWWLGDSSILRSPHIYIYIHIIYIYYIIKKCYTYIIYIYKSILLRQASNTWILSVLSTPSESCLFIVTSVSTYDLHMLYILVGGFNHSEKY